jgi:hypothetical protein
MPLVTIEVLLPPSTNAATAAFEVIGNDPFVGWV